MNSNNYETTEALLEEFRESHANNIEWAYNTQIGADGHLLAKIIPCDQISDKFKNPSNMYPNLSNDNSICDYVGSNGKQFAQEALLEWQSLCSIWPLNDDGSIPKCHGKMLRQSASTWTVAFAAVFLVAVGAVVWFYRQTKTKNSSTVDKNQLI